MCTTLNSDDDSLRDAKPPVLQSRAPLVAFGDPADGLMPGVDLDDNAALLDLMEENEPLDRRR